MELRQLRHFVAVVQAGSFTAAAVELHLAQPSLSATVARLESEFGVALLTRTARGVEPTAAGRHLLDGAARLLADGDDLAASLRRYGEGRTGAVSLAAAPVLMWHRIPRLLHAFAEAAPDVQVRLTDPPPWQAIDMLRSRSADVAAVMVADPRRFASRLRGEFDLIDWGAIPLVAALPADRADAPDPLPLQAIEGIDLVMPRRSAAVPSLPEAAETAFLRHGVRPRSVREVDTIQTTVPLVEAGLAAAIMPDPDGASLARFSFVSRRLDPAPTPLRAFVLTRTGAARDAAIARMLDVAVALTGQSDSLRSAG